jgi:hypothetical protein
LVQARLGHDSILAPKRPRTPRSAYADERYSAGISTRQDRRARLMLCRDDQLSFDELDEQGHDFVVDGMDGELNARAGIERLKLPSLLDYEVWAHHSLKGT